MIYDEKIKKQGKRGKQKEEDQSQEENLAAEQAPLRELDYESGAEALRPAEEPQPSKSPATQHSPMSSRPSSDVVDPETLEKQPFVEAPEGKSLIQPHLLQQEENAPKENEPDALPDANTLKSSVSMQRFAQAASDIYDDWENMDYQQRGERFKDAIHQELSAAGVPETDVILKKMPVTNQGYMDPLPWALFINQVPLEEEIAFTAGVGNVANTVYHEARHAEQSFLMARMLAGQNRTAGSISRRMFIKRSVAQQAIANPMQEGESRAEEAKLYYDSIYGKNAAERDHVLEQMDIYLRKMRRVQRNFDNLQARAIQATEAVTKQENIVEKAKGHVEYAYSLLTELSPDATNEDRQNIQDLIDLEEDFLARDIRKLNRLQSVQDERDAALEKAFNKWMETDAELSSWHSKYMDLPEEVDAWAVGNALEAEFNRLQEEKSNALP